jgi:hypothetical protein
MDQCLLRLANGTPSIKTSTDTSHFRPQIIAAADHEPTVPHKQKLVDEHAPIAPDSILDSSSTSTVNSITMLLLPESCFLFAFFLLPSENSTQGERKIWLPNPTQKEFLDPESDYSLVVNLHPSKKGEWVTHP